MEIHVGDPRDERLADYVSLRDSQLRKSIEAERGMFIAEGTKIIERAAAAGCVPRSFLLQQRWLDDLGPILQRWSGVPCYVVTADVAEQVSGFHVHRGALASFERPEQSSWEDVLAGSRIMVCERLVDHTNAGGIFRVAGALGWDAVVTCPEGADPLYRRAIKASMGLSLAMPWRRMSEPETDLQRLRDAGFTLVATTLSDDSMELDHLQVPQKVALLLGNEGHGLSQEWSDAADYRVKIPMADGVDSLNVATAAAICGYVLR